MRPGFPALTALPVFGFGNPRSCTYCGDPPDSRDHVIAVAYQHNGRTAASANHSGPWCWACRDCNFHLSSRFFDTFQMRCDWAHQRLANKVKPIQWAGWELAALDYGLREKVKNEMLRRKWMSNRADFYGSREFFLNLESLVWEVGDMQRKDTGADFLRRFFRDTIREVAQIYRPR